MLKAEKSELKHLLFIFGLLVIGFIVRIFFVSKYVEVSGDLLVNAAWGEKFWQYGPKDFYFVDKWYYAAPNYPQLSSLMYGVSYWLFDYKYILPQIHNTIKIVPAFFIIYFYDYGYYLLLKLPSILADLGLSVLIYKVVWEISKERRKAIFALSFYLFNPVSIFISAVWGQTDSLVALFALTSFLLLFRKNFVFSAPLLVISLFIKPNWIIAVPIYLLLLYFNKPKLNSLFTGSLTSLAVIVLSTLPFSGRNIVGFNNWLVNTRIIPTASAGHRASSSAFNLHTLFFDIDITPDNYVVFGVPINIVGIMLFFAIYLFVIKYIIRQKATLISVISGLFMVGFAYYLFSTNMLERYFFVGFVPMVVLAFSKPKLLKYVFVINIVVFLNIFYSFFRRSVGPIANVFAQNNFLLIRLLSFTSLITWLLMIRNSLAKK